MCPMCPWDSWASVAPLHAILHFHQVSVTFQQFWIVLMISGAFTGTHEFLLTPLHVSDPSEWCSCTIFTQFCALTRGAWHFWSIFRCPGAVWNVMHGCVQMLSVLRQLPSPSASSALDFMLPPGMSGHYESAAHILMILCVYAYPYSRVLQCYVIVFMYSACLHSSWTRPGHVYLGSTDKLHISWSFDMYWWFSLRLQLWSCHCKYLAQSYAYSASE